MSCFRVIKLFLRTICLVFCWSITNLGVRRDVSLVFLTYNLYY